MADLKNDRFIRALLRQPVDRRPFWMMRQAGRYLPEYRALRAQVPDFMTFCKTADLACEATLQPLRRFDLDAAIIFSDILTIPEAMGLDLHFVAGEGPRFSRPVRNIRDVKALRQPDPSKELGYVVEVVTQVVSELDGRVPVIGFAGSPWTIATYMVEGGSSRVFQVIKTMLYRDPQLLKALLQKLANATIHYLNAQIAAGVSVVMLFDSWGGVLSPQDYQEFSLHYMQYIAKHLQLTQHGRRIPLIIFSKGANQCLEYIADSDCDAVGLDWTINIGDARQRIGDRVALQGNMDPFLLYAKPERIQQAVKDIINDYGAGYGHVFNLGHGIHKDTPIEHVAALIAAVKEYGQYDQTQIEGNAVV